MGQPHFFDEDRNEFEAVETPEGGLGPIFNGCSCVDCHSAGATGGAGATTVTRFGRLVNGKFDPLAHRGGSLLQRFAIDPAPLKHQPVPLFSDLLLIALLAALAEAAAHELPDNRLALVLRDPTHLALICCFIDSAALQQAALTSHLPEAFGTVMAVS